MSQFRRIPFHLVFRIGKRKHNLGPLNLPRREAKLDLIPVLIIALGISKLIHLKQA